MKDPRLTLFTFAIVVLSLILSACGSGASPSSVNLPAKYQNAPARVREAYQFALSNAQALKNVPCYCGCGALGHTSNYSCFIQSDFKTGPVQFDDHALGCSVCVDIAQDVMRYAREGKSAAQIRELIVATYSQYGPPNQ